MIKNNYPEFLLQDINSFTTLDLSNEQYPARISTWSSGNLKLEAGATHFGIVYKGNIELKLPTGNRFNLGAGMYFSVNSSAEIVSNQNNSSGLVVSSLNYYGFFNIGGPVEQQGRYKYIDGCSDSLLLSPVLKGDPCLNLLFFPAGIFQTPHTHPSVRVGLILEGSGQCVMPDKVFDLLAGQVFIIKADILHSFRTEKSSMKIVVYHPDSDFGPTDHNHPMINRTFINGISASLLVD